MTIPTSDLKWVASAVLELGGVAHKRPLSSPHLYYTAPQVDLKKQINKKKTLFSFLCSLKQLAPKCTVIFGIWRGDNDSCQGGNFLLGSNPSFSVRLFGVVVPIK